MLAGCQSQLHPSDHSFLARICMSLLCWDCPCCSHPWSWEQCSVKEHSAMNDLRVTDEDALSSSHLVSWPSHVQKVAFVRISFPGRRAAFPPTNSICLGLNEVHCRGVLSSLPSGQPRGLSEDGEHLGNCHPDRDLPAPLPKTDLGDQQVQVIGLHPTQSPIYMPVSVKSSPDLRKQTHAGLKFTHGVNRLQIG